LKVYSRKHLIVSLTNGIETAFNNFKAAAVYLLRHHVVKDERQTVCYPQ